MTDQAAQPVATENKADRRLLIEQVVRTIVDFPDQVSVEAEQEHGETVFYLAVAPKDIGKVIGKQGKTARALRSLLDAAAGKLNQRCQLEILEEEDLEPASDTIGAEADIAAEDLTDDENIGNR